MSTDSTTTPVEVIEVEATMVAEPVEAVEAREQLEGESVVEPAQAEQAAQDESTDEPAGQDEPEGESPEATELKHGTLRDGENGPEAWCADCKVWHPMTSEFYYKDTNQKFGFPFYITGKCKPVAKAKRAELRAQAASGERTVRSRKATAPAQLASQDEIEALRAKLAELTGKPVAEVETWTDAALEAEHGLFGHGSERLELTVGVAG